MNNTLRKYLYSFLLLLAALIASNSALGQDLTIHPTFNNMYGAGSFEDLYASFETSDGGFILGGKAFQNATTGNINDPFCGTNNSDYWIVKTDIDGNTEWDTLFGGTANEEFYDIIETSDGGFALVGRSTSPASCDVPAGNPFVYDAWVVKIDALGNILWTSRFGSTQGDNAKSIIETSDGGLLIGGDTMNVVDNAPDYWITKLDGTTGAVLWDNSIGGDDYDFLEVVRETTDGFFLGGYSISGASKDKTTANFGSWDYWVVKVDLSGNYVWDISYGGSGNDQLWDMEVTSDGGLIISGFSDSDPSILPNNKTAANIGLEDCWAIKVNSAGAITWDRSYGGVDLDRIYSVEVVELTDCVTNYIFGGITNSSASGDVADPNIGAGDYWINFVDASGNLIWEKNYGGDQYEEIRDFRRNSDGSYIVGGYTISDNNGDVPSTNYGIFDNWAFKLSCNFDIPDLADEEVCEGESITLTAVSGICLNCTYQWDANGGNAATNSITVTPTDTTTYTVIVTNSTCCPDTTSATVIWHPSPTVDLGPDTEICPGENVPLDATTPTCTYAWSTGATTPTINPTMAGTYSVTITCEFGCTATDEIVINPGIVPTVDLGNNTTLCAGDSILLDAGAGGMDYDWSTGATSQMIYGNDETDYCVTVTSVDGCTTVDCISINYDTIQVVLPNDTMLCPSETLVVSAGNIGCAYNWSNGLMSQSITISTAGTYTVTVTCGPASCTSVDEIVVGYFSVNSPQNVVEEICQGDSLFVGGAWQFVAGNYSDTYLTADGCDSIVNTNLMVHPTFSQNVPMEICQGDSLFVGGDWQFSNGSYSDTLMTVHGCDSIIITDLVVYPIFSTNVLIEICQGETYFAQGAAQNMTGTYFDTLMTVDGCDSIIITDLIVNPTFSQNVLVEICQGESYFAGGAAQTMTGSYPDTLMTIDGCDSIIITDLVVNPVFSQNVSAEICQGDSIFVGGDWQFSNGSYPDTLLTINNCDSIIITDLMVNPIFSQNVSAEICQGDSLFVGGDWQFSNGSYPDTLMTVNGCDSIIITDLVVNPIFSTNVPIEICQGETYFAQGAAQNMTGTYFDTLMTVDGCDSIIITDLMVNPTFSQNVEVEICQGESYFAGGVAQTMTGSYADTLMTIDGCDSIIITDLVVNPVFSQNVLAEICQGDSIFVGGDWRFSVGSYPDTLLTINNCDSIIITDLMVNPVFSQNVSAEICQGDSLFVGGDWQFLNGSYSDTLMSVDGCDSIIITDLVVNPIFSTNVPIEICQGETYFAQGAAQNMTGTYFDSLMTVDGCDSIIITDLIVNPTFSQNVPVEICQGESYFAGGAAQTMTGSYPDTLMTIDGCDSIIITDMVVNPVFSQNIDAEICQGDSIFVGGDWQFSFGSYPDTLLTINNCDSIIITDLMVNPIFSQNVSAEICQGDSLFVGGDWQFLNGSYSDTLMSVDGCDSIIITDLVVNPIFSTNVPIEICQGETYFAQGAAQNMKGTYFDTLMTVDGCDSIIITDLMVNPTFSQNVEVEICQGESYFAGGVAQTMTGSYADTLMTIDGCDSIIITDLVVNPVFSQNVLAEICQGDSIFVGGDWRFSVGSYPDTLLTINNCDSIIITDLMVNPVFSQNVSAEICQGDSLFVGGDWQFLNGSYSDTLMSVDGCDSIIITDLVVNPIFSTNVPIEICQGETYFAQGAAQNMTGTYFDTLMTVDGCDSIIITDLIVNPTFSQNVPVEICQGESYFAGGAAQTMTGSYPDTLMTIDGCDSIIITDLVVNPVFSQNIDAEICQGDSIFLENDWQFTAGFYSDTLMTVFGCDSIFVTNLEIRSTFSQNVPIEICQGDSIFLENDWQFFEGSYSDTLMTVDGCDSIIITDLVLNDTFEIMVDTMICNSALVGLDTINLFSQNGCDSNVIYNFMLIDIDTFTFEEFTCDSNLVDTLVTNATGMNGECDSILVNIISLAPSYEINIDTTTCNASQVGLDTIFMSSVFGCDSNLIYNYQLIDADSFFFQNFTCDSNLVDTTFANASGINGECDSILVNIISLAPSYEFNFDTTTCIALQVGLDTIFMNSVFGCDSNLIYDYQLIDADSFFFQNFTCDSNLVDTIFSNATGMNGECDSILVNIISLAPSFEINIDTTTCIASQVGLDTIFMNSVFGCDSNLIYNFQLIDADSFFFESFTCDSNLVDTTFANASGMNGECDSILVNIISLAPSYEFNIDTTTCIASQVGLDTIFMNSVFGCDSNLIYDYQLIDADSFFFQNFTCDSNLVDTIFSNATGMNGECDSILVNIISLAPNFEINIDTTTCIASQVGLDTIFMNSVFGCDSNLIYDYQLIDADSFFFQNFTCDSNLVDTIFSNATGMNGECDSILVNIISLAPSFEINIDTTTCIASQVGLDTIFMNSVFGCDSNLIYNFQLIDADSFFFESFTCDSNLVDTTFANASGMNGECDSILVNIISLAPSYEFNIDTTTCIASQVGLDTIYLMSQFGCDSTVIFNYELLAADTFILSETSCDSTLLGTTTMNLPGMNGECDSILIINTTFACDTIYINSTSCNPLDTGIFIQLNGSNTIIDSVSLAPTDSTYLMDNSCNPLDTGLMLTSTLQNIYGCDSLIFTYTSLLPSQNILIESKTCDASQIGIFIDTLQNQFGCDSIVTNSISLSPSSIDTILTLSCFIDDVGTDTLFVGTNSLGCDSLVVAITAYEQVIEAFVNFSGISCFGESDGVILVDSVLGGTPPYLYSIDNMPFQSTPIFTNLSADNYTILIEDADGCQTLAVVPLNSINEIIVDLGEDLFINIGDSVTIFAQINIDAEKLDTIIWTTVDSINCSGNCLDFTVTPFQTTTYSIMILDENGCSSQDEITVVVDENIPVYIPNAFSPNEDNYNDKITIFGNSELIEEVQFFRIFDRWGELVYHAESFQPNDPDNGWNGNLDGQPLNPAVFVYFAEVRFIDGSIKQFKGDITLVR